MADPTKLEALCSEVIEASPFGLLVHDAEGNILLFNSRLEEITGYAAVEIPDITTWFRLVYPNEEYRKIVLAEPRDDAAPGASSTLESMITRRDGRTAMCRFDSVRLESGRRMVFIQPVEEPAALAAAPAESESHLRLLYQSSPLATIVWIRKAEDFILVSFNAAARNLIGHQLEPSLGRPCSSNLTFNQDFLESMRRCLAESRTLQSEFRMTGADGAPDKYIKTTFICAASNLVVAHMEELTRPKLAKEEIGLKEERFQELVNLLPVTVYEMDPAGKILFLNTNGYERFGVSPEDIERGFYPIQLLIPEDRERARQNVSRVLDGTYSGPNEYTAVLKDGRRVSHTAHSRPLVRDGRVVGSLGVIIDTTESKDLEAILREKEERLRMAVEAAKIGIYTTDLETGNRQWSAEMYAIAGRPPGSIRTDEEAWSIVHPEDRERVLEIHRQALAPEGDGNFYSEHRIVRPNGEVRWIIWQGRTFFRETPSGRTPIRRLGACIDITERKLTEIELTRSQNKFSKMINASPHGIAITTFAEGRYLDASPAEFFLTGFRREEIIGRRVLDINFYEDPEDSRNIRRLLTEHGSINNYRFRFRKKSGELRWGLFSAGIIEFEGQKCILSAVSDMTDLHDAEEALKLSEERLRMATEGASIGWWDWDIKSGAVTCNDIYYTMLGYAPQEFPLSFERWKELLFPDDREAILPRLSRVLSGNLPVFSVEFRIKCKDGGWRWVQGIGRVFERDADDGAVRAIGIHADIHERKMAEEELLRANQELEARVKQRTATLEALNESLQNEIASRQAVEDKLRAKTEELAEINNALRVVLRKSREESDEIATKIFTDIRELALPFLEKLKLTSPKGRQAAYLQLLEEALSEITSSEPTSLLDLQRKLTPGEYQVAVLIRQGRTSKQLAEILSLSCRTIESHRKSIRKKLGLQNRKANLRSHLASIGNDRLKY